MTKLSKHFIYNSSEINSLEHGDLLFLKVKEVSEIKRLNNIVLYNAL